MAYFLQKCRLIAVLDQVGYRTGRGWLWWLSVHCLQYQFSSSPRRGMSIWSRSRAPDRHVFRRRRVSGNIPRSGGDDASPGHSQAVCLSVWQWRVITSSLCGGPIARFGNFMPSTITGRFSRTFLSCAERFRGKITTGLHFFPRQSFISGSFSGRNAFPDFHVYEYSSNKAMDYTGSIK